jgi:hypothetical protein
MLRILTQINYSNPKNPGADSGLQMQASMMKALLRENEQTYFYVLFPQSALMQWARAFNHPRIRILAAGLPPRQGGGAFHFDSLGLDRLIDLRRLDIDLLLINQPELTPAFLDYFNKRYFFHIPAISYVHWLDWRRYDSLKNRAAEPSILATLSGALLSERVACNSAFGRQRILEVAGRWFNDESLAALATKLVPLHPAVEVSELIRYRCVGRSRKIQIIVPHRAQKYTGFKTLIERFFPAVWDIRRDFQVLVTNPSRYDFVRRYEQKYPFLKVLELNRAEYLESLWNADIVIGSHVGCNQWSVATLEGICANCIPLLSSDGFYKEMLAPLIKSCEWPQIEARWFYFRGEFVNRLLQLIENIHEERQTAKVIGRRARVYYDWRLFSRHWAELFESAAKTAPMIGHDSRAFQKLLCEIEHTGKCSKIDLLDMMRWHPKSRHIPWTKYRRRLLTVTKEIADATDVIFTSNGNGRNGI